jgi:hypothetical protein
MFGGTTSSASGGPCNAQRIFLWTFSLLFLAITVFGLMLMVKNQQYGAEQIPDGMHADMPDQNSMLNFIGDFVDQFRTVSTPETAQATGETLIAAAPTWLPQAATAGGLAGLYVTAKCSNGALKASTYISFLLLLGAAMLLFYNAYFAGPAQMTWVKTMFGIGEGAFSASIPFYLMLGGLGIPVFYLALEVAAGVTNGAAGMLKGNPTPTVVYPNPNIVLPAQPKATTGRRRLFSPGCEAISMMLTWVAFLLCLCLYYYLAMRPTSSEVVVPNWPKCQYIEKKAPTFVKGHRSNEPRTTCV